MGAILVKCPRDGREFSTGIQVEQEDFKTLPETVVKSRCPHCGAEHLWRPSQARLIDGPPANQQVDSFRFQ